METHGTQANSSADVTSQQNGLGTSGSEQQQVVNASSSSGGSGKARSLRAGHGGSSRSSESNRSYRAVRKEAAAAGMMDCDEKRDSALSDPEFPTSPSQMIAAYMNEAAQEGGKWSALKNPNVTRVLAFCFVDGGAFSIWNQQVFQVFIEQLGGKTAVGWMSAASGISQMVAAVVAGFIGDKVKRQTVLRAGMLAGIIAVAISIGGLFSLSLAVFYIAKVMWGAYSGVVATGTEAIFADSVATGRRAFVYNLKWMDQTLSSVTGLLTTAILLVHMGNEWKRSSLVKTMTVGLCIHPIAMLILCTLKDKYIIHEEEEEGEVVRVMGGGRSSDVVVIASGEVETTVREDTRRHDASEEEDSMVLVEVAKPKAEAATTMKTQERRQIDEEGEGGYVDNRPFHHHHYPSSETEMHHMAAEAPPPMRILSIKETIKLLNTRHAYERRVFLEEQHRLHSLPARCWHAIRYYWGVMFSWEAVPYFACLVDFLVAFGSGMTMQYLSLFLIQDYGASPGVLITAQLIICPLQAILSLGVQYLGDFYVGRLPSTIISRLSGTWLMVVMSSTRPPIYIMLPIYVVRNALMNSTRGVSRSVIMDCVAKENRAKWSAFESFSSFTWAGSAVIGGYIADAHGYQYSFAITALFHFFALAMLVPAMCGARVVEEALVQQNWRKWSTKKAAAALSKERAAASQS